MRLREAKLFLCALLVAAFAGGAIAGTGTDGDPFTVCASGCDFTSVVTAVNDPGTASGAFIELQGDIDDEGIMTRSISNVTIRSQAGSTFTVTHAGGVGEWIWESTNGSHDNWTISNVNFAGDGASDQSGIEIIGGDNLTIENCTFTGLRGAYHDATGGGGVGRTLTNLTITSPQPSARLSTPGIYLFDCDGVTIDGLYFDGRGVAVTGWTSVILIRSTTDVTIQNSNFFADDDEAILFIRGRDASQRFTLTRSTFTGGGVNAVQVAMGGLSQAADDFDDSVVKFCTFNVNNAATRALEFEASNVGAGESRNILIQSNWVYGTALGSSGGIYFTENTVGVKCMNNYVSGVTSGIVAQSTHFPQISGNTLSSCTNGIVYSANGVIAGEETLAASQGGNFFQNCTNGTVMDMFDTVAGAIARQDSLYTVSGDIFSGVTNIGVWVDEADASTNYTTISSWTTHLKTMSGIRSYGVGNAVLSPEDAYVLRATGVIPSTRPLGPIGPHF